MPAENPETRSDSEGLSHAMRNVDETERQEKAPDAQAYRAIQQQLEEPPPSRADKSDRHVKRTQTIIIAEGESIQGDLQELARRREEANEDCDKLIAFATAERDRKLKVISAEEEDARAAYEMLKAAVLARSG